MAEGFKVLQVAVDDRNFQEGLITALPRSGLLEQADAADERGASDGRSQLIRGVGHMT
jgi:hypothetical protein